MSDNMNNIPVRKISDDAQVALNDLAAYSEWFGKAGSEIEGDIAEKAKEFLITHITKLEFQLVSRDVLIEGLIETGCRLAGSKENMGRWDALIKVWQTMKIKESVE